MSKRSVGGVHWPELDGLRALAILMVLARHSLRPFISEDAYQQVVAIGPLNLTPLFMNGWMGVDLFFVLSGFLIGRQAWSGRDSLGRFWFKRATRILPAYWTCLAFVALTLTAAGTWPRFGAHFLAHVVMLQDYTGSIFVPAFWSLGAEEKFYLLAPFFVVALTRVGNVGWQAVCLFALWLMPIASRLVLVGGLDGTVSYADYFPLYRSPFHLTSESLVVGFTIAWASLRLPPLTRPAREASFWAGTALVLWWLVPATILIGIDAGTIVLTPATLGLGFGAMVIAVVSGPGSYSVLLAHPRWKPIATGSYSLYLTHMMILPAAGLLAVIAPLSAGPGVTARWLSLLPWYLALSCASAWLLHRLVEKPVLQWRDAILRKPVAATEDLALSPEHAKVN